MRKQITAGVPVGASKRMEDRSHIVGFPRRLVTEFIRGGRPRIARRRDRIANATAGRLGIDLTIDPADVISDDGYIGARYGVVTAGGRAAIRLVAGTEGLFLDPVYSSKAMAGLIDHIRTGRVGKEDTVIFLHTGGTPALFAYADDLVAE